MTQFDPFVALAVAWRHVLAYGPELFAKRPEAFLALLLTPLFFAAVDLFFFDSQGGDALVFLSGATAMLLLVPISIRWHRLCILNEPLDALPGFFVSRTGAYFFAQAALFVLGAVLFIPLVMMLEPIIAGIEGANAQGPLAALGVMGVFFVAAVLALSVMCRFLVVLSAIAIGNDRFKIEHAWLATKGNGLRITAGALVLALIEWGGTALLDLIFLDSISGIADVILLFALASIYVVIEMLITLVQVGYISYAYVQLVQKGLGDASDGALSQSSERS